MSIGTVYTELDLDFSKFEKSQYRVLESAKAASLSVEKNWKTLAAKSDTIYQAMANGAINSYNMISHQANVSAAEQFRAQSAMTAKINALNMEAARNPLYETLGIKSRASYEAQKNSIVASYNTIRQSGTVTANELTRIERAKNERLRELNREMVGDHESSLASMTRSVLRLYAAYYVLNQAIRAISAPAEKGFLAVEDYAQSVASLAAMAVTFGERQKGQDLAGQWRDALAYAQGMVPVLEELAAKTLLTGQETVALSNAFARSGVFLDASNAKQIESFQRISNALPLMTQGQEILRQINTEIRSLMTGANEQSSMLLTTLKALDPQIESNLKLWRTEGTVLEHIGDLLTGFGPATGMLENQWQAVKSTIDTTANQVLRGMMKPAYDDIIKSVKELNGVLIDNKRVIIDWGHSFYERLSLISKIFKEIYPYVKVFLGTPLNLESRSLGGGGASRSFAPIPKPGGGASTQGGAGTGGIAGKSDILSQEQLRDLWIKSEGERFQQATEFNEKWLADYKKTVAEQAAIAISSGAWLMEQQRNYDDTLVKMAEDKANRIIVAEQYEFERRQKGYEKFWETMTGMANELQGEAGVGMGRVMGGAKGIMDIMQGKDAYEAQVEAAYDHYQTMQELYWTDYESRVEVADAWQAYIVAAEEATANQRMAISKNMFGTMAGLMTVFYELSNQKSKVFFQLSKAFSIAETIMKTYEAAQSAYAWAATWGGPPAGAAAAAIAVAAGMARVAQIASIQPGAATTGSVHGAGGGTAIVRKQEAAIIPEKSTSRQQVIQFYIYGNVYDEKKLARELQPYLTQAQNDGVQ